MLDCYPRSMTVSYKDNNPDMLFWVSNKGVLNSIDIPNWFKIEKYEKVDNLGNDVCKIQWMPC